MDSPSNFPRYSEYKDSGVEWLGEVPAHWAATRLQRLASIRYGIGEPPQYRTEGVPLIRATNVHAGAITAEGLVLVDPSDIPEKRIVWLAAGDIIVVRSGAYTGDSAIIRDHHCPSIAGFDMVVKPNACVPQFLQYSLLSKYLKEDQIDLEKLRAAQPHLNAEELGSCVVIVPTEKEQTTIAAFLDRETAKIDALVAEQEKLIALLKEKRQAVISHAVTKGLNPDAPMKPSGVEWLGDVPAHWEMRPVGALSRRISYGFTNPMPTAESGPYMLTANDVCDGYVNYADARHTTEEAFASLLTEKSRPEIDNILITKDGTLGRVALHDGSVACINQSVASIAADTELVTPDFLCVCLRGGVYQDRMIYEAGGTTIKHIYISRLAKMPIGLPPIDEQKAVCGWLSEQMNIFNALVVEAERAITLLKERRSALISAAVTGQIDVRGAAEAQAA
ncbi:hypothetical protein G7Y82_20265 [Solimonas sp. C16B3]|uniref:Type I restriction modification DNA specificity domain-containing protein n=1 Tax=Solimonas marina TaxID=2714601 RepID=A0A969WEA6_9GAMM|nr:restriction endonuclease subunit S [Solimonas marina]NKF24649.1 hypothetical protein [Solimonas marina]